jgi:excisionase family DNA binding protein
MRSNDSLNKVEKWSSLKDITDYLGVSREAIFKWIENRGMPAHKVGRLWKFKISEIDKWIISGGASDKPGADNQVSEEELDIKKN